MMEFIVGVLSRMDAAFSGLLAPLTQHQKEIIIYIGVLLFLALHYWRRNYSYVFLAFAGMLTVVAQFGVFQIFMGQTATLADMILFVTVYGATLFIVLSDILLFGAAAWLTRRRGERWVKELDYVYLTLGTLGILATINKIDGIGDRLSGYDVFAPLILTTALVIRFVKTRADIGGWNKTPT